MTEKDWGELHINLLKIAVLSTAIVSNWHTYIHRSGTRCSYERGFHGHQSCSSVHEETGLRQVCLYFVLDEGLWVMSLFWSVQEVKSSDLWLVICAVCSTGVFVARVLYHKWLFFKITNDLLLQFRVVVTSSTSGLYGSFGQINYSAGYSFLSSLDDWFYYCLPQPRWVSWDSHTHWQWRGKSTIFSPM